MSRYVDETDIAVKSGDGGPGAVSFRREKYVPRGGPDGGDGGRGGDVIFRVKREIKSLYFHKVKKTFKAGSGRPGAGKNMTGAKGRDCVVDVPAGTVIFERGTKRVLADLTENGGRFLFLKGGKGGQGNARFATSVNRAPRYAQPGLPGTEVFLTLEIKTIADVGIVGLPNAGKSTLLAVLTEARPKVGAYPFTTLHPNLGVMSFRGDRQYVLADMPGLIEGASRGHGLGTRFLKHIERTRGLLVLLDLYVGDFEGQYDVLVREIGTYSKSLLEKPRLVVGSKRDAVSEEEEGRFLGSMPGETKLCVSAVTRYGIDALKREIVSLMGRIDEA